MKPDGGVHTQKEVERVHHDQKSNPELASKSFIRIDIMEPEATSASNSSYQGNVERSSSIRILDRDDNAKGIRLKQESFGRTSNAGSWRRGSLSFSRGVSSQILQNIQDEIVARTGDSGRISREDEYDCSSSVHLEMNLMNSLEHGVSATLPDDAVLIQTNVFGLLTGTMSDIISPVSPLTSEFISPLPTDAILHSRSINQNSSHMQNRLSSFKDNREKISQTLEYLSYLAYLALFGEIGVLTRYLLQKLFGPSVINLTSNQSALYLDLPSNMVGSFLMGWFGVVFKGDICHVSDHLAIGLTTGFLGSLTTFSGWNQKMLDLAVDGNWGRSIGGIVIVIGMMLAYCSIIIGANTAKGLRNRIRRGGSDISGLSNWRLESCKGHVVVLVALLLMLGLLWGVSGALFRKRFDDGNNNAQLWLACLVGPPGVRLLWYLAPLNGRGFGHEGSLKWVPCGTLLANVIAACIMAALATTKNAVNTEHCEIVVNSIQFGFLGCLSTVST